MRNPCSPAWARSAVLAAALISAASGLAPNVAAEEKYNRLFVFGDSYADLTLSDKPASNPLAPTLLPSPPFPPGTQSIPVWRVYPAPLKDNLGIPQIFDYAVGGATVRPGGSAVVPPNLNLPDQVSGFSTIEGQSFGPRDLVTLSIGGNDFLQLFAGSGKDPVTFGNDTALLVAGEIHKLVEKGARTFVIAGFSGMSNLEVIPAPVKPLADAYASAYFNALQADLLPDAQKGVRFFMLDFFKMGQQALADPRYGFTPTAFDGSGKPIQSLCPGGGSVCGGSINSPDQNKYLLGPDGLHLTSGGFALAAAYMANIVMAPDTIAVAPGIVSATTGGFTSSLFGRLDATRVAGVGASMAPDGLMGVGAVQRSPGPQAAPSSARFTSYAMGTFLGGSRSDSSALAGYDYESTAGTAGIEYSINRNLIFGLAGNYTTTSADLNNGANIDLDAIQAAAYLSYATKQIFADALVAYGSHDISLARPGIKWPGINDTIRGDTDASSFALGGRAGYLFDLGGLRAGPIAGLTYIHTRVGGYTEKGDPLLTFNVSAQTLDSLSGNLGLRFLAPFKAADGSLVVPYLNVLLEHQFGDGSRLLTVDQVQTTVFLPIMTSFPTFDTRTYGRVEGGVTLQLTPDLSASITGASTFARDDGQDYRVSAGLNYRF